MNTSQSSRCPFCGATEHTFLFKRRDLRFLCTPKDFSIVRCTSCGGGYILDAPDAEALKEYYPEAFFSKNHESSGAVEKLQKKLALVEKFKPLPLSQERACRILDVGCAGGEFIAYATQHGYDAYGYEVSEIPSKTERIVQSPSLENVYEDASFDIITSWAVLEHMLNLDEQMRNISRLLRQEGVFVALVPNFNSIAGRLMRQDDVPRHLNFFTRKAMNTLLARHQLAPVKYIFSDEIFSGSNHGFLVFLFKALCGERWDDILVQHRAPGKRQEFCRQLHGKPSRLNELVCAFDSAVFTPCLDRLVNWLHFGFIMTVIAKKV